MTNLKYKDYSIILSILTVDDADDDKFSPEKKFSKKKAMHRIIKSLTLYTIIGIWAREKCLS